LADNSSFVLPPPGLAWRAFLHDMAKQSLKVLHLFKRQSIVGIIFRLSKPDKDLRSLLVDTRHQGNLIIAFV
jgi:hypothetical protein